MGCYPCPFLHWLLLFIYYVFFSDFCFYLCQCVTLVPCSASVSASVTCFIKNSLTWLWHSLLIIAIWSRFYTCYLVIVSLLVFAYLLHGRAGRDSSRAGWHGTLVRSNLSHPSVVWCHDPANDCDDSRKNHVRQSRVQLPAHTDGMYWLLLYAAGTKWTKLALLRMSLCTNITDHSEKLDGRIQRIGRWTS